MNFSWGNKIEILQSSETQFIIGFCFEKKPKSEIHHVTEVTPSIFVIRSFFASKKIKSQLEAMFVKRQQLFANEIDKNAFQWTNWESLRTIYGFKLEQN